ncbi:hypothetical protein [Helicobacter gastrocanis]|uniref:hypothetical protein n=1 Tax=Helicobacter gastrocanis TaxID=2849641 RepID=UPI001C842662|nr:hypothetical protein [Helicobacter sp. NHP19-003]
MGLRWLFLAGWVLPPLVIAFSCRLGAFILATLGVGCVLGLFEGRSGLVGQFQEI